MAKTHFSGPVDSNTGFTSKGLQSKVYPDQGMQTLSGAGAIDIVSSMTQFTSTGATDALTLADGTVTGQSKKIIHVVDGGSGILTPVTALGFSTITLADVGDYVELTWTVLGWVIVEKYNTASGDAGPATA